MGLSAKQLAMAWINSKFEPERINPELEEFTDLNGGKEPSQKVQEEAKKFIIENIQKLKKTKYQPYVDKYCNLGRKDVSSSETESSGE